MKRIVYSILMAMSIASMAARTPISQWFTTMPDSVMPLLTKNNRLDFIDFLDSKMEAVVTNRMDGKSRMERLTDDYLLVSYTQSSNVEMKLLPVNDTTDVLCMVTTLKTTVNDSRVCFFDEGWRPLDSSEHFMEPTLKDFRTDEVSDSADMAWKKLDVPFKSYSLSPDHTILTCRITAVDYLNKEDRQAVLPYLKCDSITYSWENGRFVAL